MWTSVCLVLALSVLHATTAWAGGWNEPAQVLGLAWGAPVEAAKQQFPGGWLSQETASTLAYTVATHLDGIPLIASFQFVSEGGLLGAALASHRRRGGGERARRPRLAVARGAWHCRGDSSPRVEVFSGRLRRPARGEDLLGAQGFHHAQRGVSGGAGLS